MTTLSILALIFLAVSGAFLWIGWKVLQGVGYVLRHVFAGFGFVLGRVFTGIGFLLRHVFRYVRATVVDAVHLVGAIFTGALIVPLALVNFLIGRWGAAKHFGGAFEDELISGLLGVYRIAIAHPLKLLGLGSAVDRVQRRIPELVDRAPRPPQRGDAFQFDGYDITGTLPSGGSGAQLFLARPRPDTLQRFRDEGRELADEVVIKSFALEQGSTLPQIVRESRALEAANRLGLVYEHRLTPERFHYVMRYVRGDELDTVVHRLHARSAPEGLDERELASVVGYAQDLLRTLQRFHAGDLWHKDVKPANVIVADGRAHLVDFGLVTPLSSAMTLTTHGTEYYRDPEMVRLAMQGVKVHEVDGVKFDLYSVGAVLFSMVENDFPAHGSLSRIAKRCPEALAWIVHRAMTDMQNRYGSAREMLQDLAALAAAPDPFAVRPFELPSVSGQPIELASEADEPQLDFAAYAAQATARAQRVSEELPASELPQPELPKAVRRRRRRRVVAAAALIWVFFMAVGRLTESAFHDHARPSRSTVAYESRLRPSDQRTLRLARDILDDVSVDDEVQGLADQWRRALEPLLPAEQTAREARGARAAAQQVSDGGRVLVLEDIGQGADESTVTALHRALALRGFEVFGDEEGEVDPEEIRLVAGARHAVGLSDPRDDGALQELQRYLDRTGELDAIVWLANNAEEGCHLYRVLVRRDLASEPPGRFAVADNRP